VVIAFLEQFLPGAYYAAQDVIDCEFNALHTKPEIPIDIVSG
jgi:hypothetical protein